MSTLDTRDLETYQVPSGAHVLSVYLQTHSAESLTVFQEQISDIKRRFEAESEERELDNCVKRVTDFLSGFEARAPMLVLFCTATGSMWVRQVDVLLPNSVRWDDTPFWKPLLEAIDECEPYAVLLFDKTVARLLSVSLGTIHEHKRIKAAPADVASFLDLVIQAVEEMIRTECPSRLILAGDRELFSPFLKRAPSFLQNSIIAMLNLPVEATHEHILEITGNVEQLAERRFEVRQVEELVRLAAGFKKAALGLNATVDAINRGEVWRLIYSAGFSVRGGLCPTCDSLTADDSSLCPKCHAAVRPVDDLVAQLVSRAFAQDASIEQVRGKAATELDLVGGIGALLRW